MDKVVQIGIFYDGNYFHRISHYYNIEHRVQKHLSIIGIHHLVEQMVAKARGVDPKQCRICDAHLFRGRYSAVDAKSKNALFKDRVFEDVLIRANVQYHYRLLVDGREKGIDSLLTLKTFELSRLKKYDVVVLVTGDADYIPLVEMLYGIGCETMLLCWDNTSEVKGVGEGSQMFASRALWSKVTYPIAMHALIEEGLQKNVGLILDLFDEHDEKISEADSPTSTEERVVSETRNDTQTTTSKRRKGKVVAVLVKKKNGHGFLENRTDGRIRFEQRDVTDAGLEFDKINKDDELEFSLEDGTRLAKEITRPGKHVPKT